MAVLNAAINLWHPRSSGESFGHSKLVMDTWMETAYFYKYLTFNSLEEWLGIIIKVKIYEY